MINGLQKKIQQLETLMEMASLVNSTLDINKIKSRAIEAAARLVNAEAGSLLIIDQGTGELFFEIAIGEKGNILKEVRLVRGQGIAGWVAEKGESLIIHDVQSDARFFRMADEISAFTTRDLICVPVRTKDRIVGVLQAVNKKEGRFDEEDEQGLSALANHVAVAIENANLYRELREDFYETAHALAETIEQRDHYTAGHTYRVMNYSLAIGRLMGISENEMENLRLAAILHDVGKIGVRDSILLKNGKLDMEESQTMSQHTEFGTKILGHVKKLKDVLPGVRSHHEKYDGTGYPDNMQGEDIPLLARIIAVADTFDAMTSDRPYRQALSIKTAVEELKINSGVQFDPEVVRHFIKVLMETGEKSDT